MVRITLSRDLDPVPFGGWETNVATAFDDVFVSGNWFAAYSSDGGSSWVTLNPKKLQAETPGAFCDQRVLYIPQINRFAWVIMTDTEGGLNEITLAISEPVQLQDSNGRAWLRYHIWPRTVRQDDQAFDYPDISFGDSYLYLTSNIGPRGMIARLPLAELAQAAIVNMQYYIVPQSWICPVQSTGAKGFFGAHTDVSKMRVWSWAEPPSAHITSAEFPIATIRTEDWVVDLPTEQWFVPAHSPDNEITGAARLRNELWFAWMEARRVAGDHPEAQAFPFPHINTAIVDATSLKLLRQERIWSRRAAYGWPVLTANNRDVALLCVYGGGETHAGAELCVGFLTSPRELQLATSGNLGASGWHFMGVRPAYFSTTAFAGVGYNRRLVPAPENISRPRYVVFERD
jgi:hypothetical protein